MFGHIFSGNEHSGNGMQDRFTFLPRTKQVDGVWVEVLKRLAHSDVDVILNFFDFTKHTINSLASPCCHFFIRPYAKRLIRKIVFSEMIRLAAESA